MIRRIARQNGAVDIQVFGSRSTGTSTSVSYIDLLVELETGRDLQDLIGIKQDLEYELGCAVDVRFRRALSLAFNRDEMNDVLWLGAGRPSQLAPPRDSRWYDESFANSYAEYDLDSAHQLLDEMGLRWDDERRFRLRPDGERLTFIVHYPSEQTEWGNGAEMAQEYWSALGIDVIVKSSGLLDQLSEANGHQAIVWCGNGAVPTDRSFICGFTHTPLWHKWFTTNGAEGVEPAPWAREVLSTCDRMYAAPTAAERDAAAIEIFGLLAEHLYVLSTVSEAPVPFVYAKRMGNISVAKQPGYITKRRPRTGRNSVSSKHCEAPGNEKAE